MTADGVYAAHAKKNDRLTSWWRGISLRAKVTGVTVAVLTGGLLVAGFGTAVFLRNAQIAERDQSISQTVTLDQASSLLNVEVVDGVAQFEPADYPPLTSFYIAVYGPDGTRLATGGPPTIRRCSRPRSVSTAPSCRARLRSISPRPTARRPSTPPSTSCRSREHARTTSSCSPCR
jgi:hypothetical protein